MTAPKRRWFAYSLRTMFVVVTVLGILGGWLAWQMGAVHERDKLIAAHVARDMSNPDSSRIPLVWSILGASPVNSIGLPAGEFSDDDLAHYRAAFPEADVSLEERPFEIAAYSRKRWARRYAEDRNWVEAWITARSVLDAIALVAVVALIFELIRPHVRRLDRSTR
jgi:hypothetical protein